MNQQLFKCHKEVKATPMNRLDYNIYRGWDLPEDENGNDEGFLVEYVDGGKPNHADHKGYISWSPKEVFNDGYSLVTENQTPKSFIDRVKLEQCELLEKLNRLTSFLEVDAFKALPEAEQHLLVEQSIHMASYLAVLTHRISRL